MSMHKKPLTELEEAGLLMHGLAIGTPSQLSDAFREGVAWGIADLECQLAESQAREAALREVSHGYAKANYDFYPMSAIKALAAPRDDTALRQAIESAKAEEREACARICEAEANRWPYPSHANASATVAAATIRARGKR